MKFSVSLSILLSALLTQNADAFSTSPACTRIGIATRTPAAASATALYMADEAAESKDEEIERLRSMAAKLRAEAAALEAEQSQAMAQAAEHAFAKFDVNQDGKISVQELKEGLEKAFKLELPEKRVQQLMKDFDSSGDGALQLDEFVGVQQLRNRLDALARDEKAQALEKQKIAQAEKAVAELLEQQVGVINDRPPTTTDRFVSVLPYLFPLLDGFQYARFLVLDNPDNVLALIPTLVYALYRSIPFGGFISFFALYYLAGRPGINRLVRYNMQQAIFLDIALFFPGLLSALIGLTGVPLPQELVVLSSDALFGTLLLSIAYAAFSSLVFGKVPDQIPFISEAVNARVPTADTILTSNQDVFRQLGVNLPGKEDEDKNKKDDQDDENETRK